MYHVRDFSHHSYSFVVLQSWFQPSSIYGYWIFFSIFYNLQEGCYENLCAYVIFFLLDVYLQGKLRTRTAESKHKHIGSFVWYCWASLHKGLYRFAFSPVTTYECLSIHSWQFALIYFFSFCQSWGEKWYLIVVLIYNLINVILTSFYPFSGHFTCFCECVWKLSFFSFFSPL